MDRIEHALGAVAGWIWGPPMIVLLLGTHLFYTIRLGFIQRHGWRGIRLSVERDPAAPGSVSPFGALATALAATVGAGNIVGVATAVAMGGPGAVFWLWLTGLLGFATKYAEAVLAVKYRVQRQSGEFAGGPMYVLERGLRARWLGVTFAVCAIPAGLGGGCMFQASTLADLCAEALPEWSSTSVHLGAGVVMAVVVAAVILGGLRSIARVSTVLVPVMGAIYVVGCVGLLATQWQRLPETFGLILGSAFNGQAAVGGFVGAGVAQALRFGVARGLFSNEAGLGSAAIAAAAARTRDPVRQGLVSATGTFWDTVVLCALTGLVVVGSGAWQEGLTGAALTRAAFAPLGAAAPWIVDVSLGLFIFSTLVGAAYYGEKAWEYLTGGRGVVGFRWTWVACVLLGANLSSAIVWHVIDITWAAMAVPNLLGLLALHKVVVGETRAGLAALLGRTNNDVAAEAEYSRQ